MSELYPEDRWEPTDTAEVLVGHSGPDSTLTDNPPESMPESRPVRGFHR